MAPSTLGTFLRSFTWGHVRRFDKAAEQVPGRAWSTGAGPGTDPVIIDVDSTICEVSGKTKAGAAYGHTGESGYHPLVAARAETGEVLHTRLRKGSPKAATPTSSPRRSTEPGADAYHRAHATVELAIRDLKQSAGLEHLPSETPPPTPPGWPAPPSPTTAIDGSPDSATHTNATGSPSGALSATIKNRPHPNRNGGFRPTGPAAHSWGRPPGTACSGSPRRTYPTRRVPRPSAGRRVALANCGNRSGCSPGR